MLATKVATLNSQDQGRNLQAMLTILITHRKASIVIHSVVDNVKLILSLMVISEFLCIALL